MNLSTLHHPSGGELIFDRISGVLSYDQQDKIEKFFLSNEFPWYHHLNTVDPTSQESKLFDDFGFHTHNFLLKGKLKSPLFQEAINLIELGQNLGFSKYKSFFKIILPSARPAIVAGLALVAMETLSDFGAVSFFGIATLTKVGVAVTTVKSLIFTDIIDESRVDTIFGFAQARDADVQLIENRNSSKFLEFRNKSFVDSVICKTNRVLVIDDVSKQFTNKENEDSIINSFTNTGSYFFLSLILIAFQQLLSYSLYIKSIDAISFVVILSNSDFGI